MKNTRREFIKTTTALSAAVSVPYIWTSGQAIAQDKNGKLTVAAIGVGGPNGRYSRGGTVANQAAKFGEMVAVCDVDSENSGSFSKKHGDIKQFKDYRDLLDKIKPEVVTVGTTDHWHVPIAIAALKSGSHVYCEKPLTLTIDEGKEICKVVAETGKTFQVGTQQRSEMGGKFLQAVALVQGGYLGDHVTAHVAIGGAPNASKAFDTLPVPKALDWDFWLGPARMADFSERRRKEFRWFLEYSGGKMTDWGAHHVDIAQWALGKSHTSPVSVSGKGNFSDIVPDKFDFAALFDGKAKLPNAFNAATTFNINLKFDDGALMTVNDSYESEDKKTSFGNGILFEGSKGRIFVNRGKLTGKPFEELGKADKDKLNDAVVKLYRGNPGNHMGNFFSSIKDGSEPISDVNTHHRTMTSCHMCNITLMLGRELKYDPKKQTFVGDDQAVALMTRPQRSKYIS